MAPGPKKAKKAKLDEDMEVQAAIEVQAAMEVHAELHATAVALVEALPGGTHSGPLCELKLGHQPELQRCSLFDAPQGSAWLAYAPGRHPRAPPQAARRAGGGDSVVEGA